ncbi:MAG: hypothetical protein JW953_10505 [Anaerolineae bacterium]|nr:hypothetical protein [Anaerolineae bacterium]
MSKKMLIISAMLLLTGTTVVCSLGGSGTAEADLAASLPTNTVEATEAVAEVIEEELAVSEPTATPAPSPTPEPTEETLGPLTAPEAYELALAEAQAWQADAILASMGTSHLGPLNAAGTSESWAISFWSPSAGEMLPLLFINGALNTPPTVPMPVAPDTVPAFDSVTLEMKALYDTAAAAAGSQYTGPDYYLMASLTPYPLDKSIPTWYMNFHDAQNNTVAFNVIIDARSGEVIQAVNLAEAGQ